MNIPPRPKISVCICTYNRCRSLKRTLASLVEQDAAAWEKSELVVVDNNCTDATVQVVDEFSGRLPLRLVNARQQGLSHARNCAMAEARGDWVLFTDDDVMLDSGWLSNFLTSVQEHPDAAFAGGRILPAWHGSPPPWFKGERLALLDGLLVWYDLGPDNRPMMPGDPSPFGASFAINQRFARDVGLFRTDLGVSGDSPGRGEETEFVGRLRDDGHRGIYVGRAICYHYAETDRFAALALYRHGRAKAREEILTRRDGRAGSRRNALMFLVRGLVQLARGRGDRFRQCIINAGIQHGLAIESGLAVDPPAKAKV